MNEPLPQPVAAQPVLQSADAPVKPPPAKPVPLGDFDNSMNSHLGLPFYFRHTPTRTLARASFWPGFLGVALLLVFDFIHMPYARGTTLYAIRLALFEQNSLYSTFAEGGDAIFSQLFVLAIIISSIIAPLFATFSLSSERVLGTMEFLRLSPMSTLSIVIGKMFAPAYTLHLFSGALLLVGIAVGLLCGQPIGSVFFAALVIVLGAAVMHALGAFLAAFTTTFRGFGSVFGLLGFGFLISMLPQAAHRERGLMFFTFLSPWSTMDTLFWHRQSDATVLFAGQEGWVTPFTIYAFVLVFVLLVWAATRKLDRPEAQSLPFVGWFVLWTSAVGVGFSVVPNFSGVSYRSGNMEWGVASAIIMIGGLITCALALLDHPHSRDAILVDECERASHPTSAQPGPWRLRHAAFVTTLVAATAAILTAIVYAKAPLNKFEWSVAIPLALLPVLLALTFALMLETSAIRFNSKAARFTVSWAGISIFLGIAVAPIIHMEQCYSRWNNAIYMARQYYATRDNPKVVTTKSGQSINYTERYRQQLYRVLASPDEAMYLDGVETAERASDLIKTYQDEPLALFYHYHGLAFAAYPIIFLMLFVLLVNWRRRNYTALRREAIKAVGPPERGPEPTGATQELAQAV